MSSKAILLPAFPPTDNTNDVKWSDRAIRMLAVSCETALGGPRKTFSLAGFVIEFHINYIFEIYTIYGWV